LVHLFGGGMVHAKADGMVANAAVEHDTFGWHIDADPAFLPDFGYAHAHFAFAAKYTSEID